MKASLIFFPNTAKKNQQSCKVPLYLRVWYKKGKAESRLNFDLTPDQLKLWNGITMRLQERNAAVNHYLNRIESTFHDFLIANATRLEEHSAADIRDAVLGLKKDNYPTLLTFVDSYFESTVMNNSNIAPGTTKVYRRSINHLKAFLSFKKQETLLINQVNYEFASEFKNFLVCKNEKLDRAGMKEVSAAGVIKKFRRIFTHAVELDLLTKNPFKQVRIQTKSPRKQRLSAEQVGKIYKLDLTLWPSLPLYRDIFLFSAFTGLAYSDAISLSFSNLDKRSDGNMKLFLGRQKSAVVTESFLPTPAIDIISRYSKEYHADVINKIFPCRSNKEINSQLKLIAQMIGVQFSLTTHTGRHTYRQLLGEAGIGDDAVIKRMMGHSRRGDIDDVYYKVTDTNLFEAKEKFQNFLNKFLL